MNSCSSGWFSDPEKAHSPYLVNQNRLPMAVTGTMAAAVGFQVLGKPTMLGKPEPLTLDCHRNSGDSTGLSGSEETHHAW